MNEKDTSTVQRDMRNSNDKLWNANYNKVMLANFCLSFAFYLMTPLLPLYLADTYGAGKDEIGMALAGYTIAALLIRPFSGFVVDSFDRKKVLLICFFMYALFFAGYLLAGSILMFAIVRTLHGAPFGASTVANNTVAIDVLPSSRRAEGISYYGLSNNIATAIAPTIGIWMYQYVSNFDALFAASLIVATIGFLVNLSVQLPKREPVLKKQPLSLDRFFLIAGWLIAVNMVLYGFCYGVLSSYLAIYGRERMGITSGTGTFFFLLALGLILSRIQGTRSLREGKVARNAAIGMCISTFGYLLFVAVPEMWAYYMTAILIGIGNGHMWPAFMNMIIGVARNDQRGTATSTLLISWDLGIGLGMLVGGFIAEHVSYTAAFWSTVVAHVVGVVLFFFATRAFYERRRLR